MHTRSKLALLVLAAALPLAAWAPSLAYSDSQPEAPAQPAPAEPARDDQNAPASRFDAFEPITELADGPLKALEPLMGVWSIDAEWSWGQPLNARNIYRVGLGGRFIEQTTRVSDNNGPVYERYKTIYAADPATGAITAHGFTHDGSVTTIPARVETEGEGADTTTTIHTEWTSEGTTIRQTLAFAANADTARWTVLMNREGTDGFQTIMDADYHRVSE